VLFKAKQKPGWLSLAVSRDRVDIAQVSRPASGRPLVSLCETYRREGSLEHTMTRLRRDRGLDGFRLTALMPAGQYQLLQVDAPDVPAAELVSALRWRLKDLIDFPVELAVVETMLVPAAGEGAGGRQSQVFAVVARADAVRQHVEPLQRSGLGLAAIDIHETSDVNTLATVGSEKFFAVHAAIAFCAAVSALCQLSNHSLLFARTSGISRSHINPTSPLTDKLFECCGSITDGVLEI
jgi:MSHA biogenesis protein MshI